MLREPEFKSGPGPGRMHAHPGQRSKRCASPTVTPANRVVTSEMVIFCVCSLALCYIPNGSAEKIWEGWRTELERWSMSGKGLGQKDLFGDLYPSVVL